MLHVFFHRGGSKGTACAEGSTNLTLCSTHQVLPTSPAPRSSQADKYEAAIPTARAAALTPQPTLGDSAYRSPPQCRPHEPRGLYCTERARGPRGYPSGSTRLHREASKSHLPPLQRVGRPPPLVRIQHQGAWGEARRGRITYVHSGDHDETRLESPGPLPFT